MIALIWATLGMSFYESPEALNAILAQGGPAAVVNDMATSLLGAVGGILAIFGVIVLPITSGDTSFRAARLILSDFLRFDQKPVAKRLMIALPLFAAGSVVSQMDFNVIWRYFGWANQMTAVIMLWAAASWLKRHDKFHWICTVPAVFMTGVVNAYLLSAEIGFGLPLSIAGPIGLASSAVALAWLLLRGRRERDEQEVPASAAEQA